MAGSSVPAMNATPPAVTVSGNGFGINQSRQALPSELWPPNATADRPPLLCRKPLRYPKPTIPRLRGERRSIFGGPGSRAVRDFVVHNALYWIEQFNFDGLRLDAVHAIRDDSPKLFFRNYRNVFMPRWAIAHLAIGSRRRSRRMYFGPPQPFPDSYLKSRCSSWEKNGALDSRFPSSATSDLISVKRFGTAGVSFRNSPSFAIQTGGIAFPTRRPMKPLRQRSFAGMICATLPTANRSTAVPGFSQNGEAPFCRC
jgi:hypothetical protein